VKQKTASRQWAVAEEFVEASPSLETMKARGEITLGSQVELGGENFLLSVVAQAGLPAVEADFTDNTWASVEMLLEFG
jgi:hypothetical protein